jgi:PleD family two-component response regulator
MTALRILVVESDLEEAQFLKDVLAEIGEGRYWEHWTEVSTIHAATIEESANLINSEAFDAVLLAVDRSAWTGVNAFIALRDQAPQIPILLLAGAEDLNLCLRLLREGAEDFLIRRELDCAPLAHAIRAAIERHRLAAALRSESVVDPLTGLPNAAGFSSFASRDLRIASALEHRLLVGIAERTDLKEISASLGPAQRDIAIMESADYLRSLVYPMDLIARVGPGRFGILMWGNTTETLEATTKRLSASVTEAHMRLGTSIFDPNSPQSLDELIESAILNLSAPLAQAMRQ